MRHLLARLAGSRPAIPVGRPRRVGPGCPGAFPMIDGGVLACPDLAAALVTLAVCVRRPPNA